MYKPVGRYDLFSAGWKLPSTQGIYFLYLNSPVEYESGITPVIYIGSSSNLQERVRTHCRKSHSWGIREIQKHFDVTCDAYEVLTSDREELYRVEEAVLYKFHQKFGTLPLLNVSIPTPEDWRTKRPKTPFHLSTPKSDKLIKLVEIGDALGVHVKYRDIVYKLDKHCVNGKWTGHYAFQYLKVFALPNDFMIENPDVELRESDPSLRFRRGPFVTKIEGEHVVAWSHQKVRRLLELCDSLEFVERKFDGSEFHWIFHATTVNVPSPDTWGEVAILLGRRNVGTWIRKDKQVEGRADTFEISCGDVALGFAVFENYGVPYGHDATWSMQRIEERPEKDYSMCDWWTGPKRFGCNERGRNQLLADLEELYRNASNQPG